MDVNSLGADFKYEEAKNLQKRDEVATSEIWSCIKDKGFLICYECKDFPCEHYSWLHEKYPAKLKDYERFRELGLEEWQRFHERRTGVKVNP